MIANPDAAKERIAVINVAENITDVTNKNNNKSTYIIIFLNIFSHLYLLILLRNNKCK